MAHYIVRPKTKPGRLPQLSELLPQNTFLHLRPFGRALTDSLTNARVVVVQRDPQSAAPSGRRPRHSRPGGHGRH